MPNISFWGHLSGLVVGILLISQIGVSLFMPTYGTNVFCLQRKIKVTSLIGIFVLADCMVYLEQMVPCCRPLVLCGGYVPVRDKDLVPAYLQCGTAGGGGGGRTGTGTGDCCSSCCAGMKSGLQAVAGAICYAFVFFWQILVFLLTMIGKSGRLVWWFPLEIHSINDASTSFEFYFIQAFHLLRYGEWRTAVHHWQTVLAFH